MQFLVDQNMYENCDCVTQNKKNIFLLNSTSVHPVWLLQGLLLGIMQCAIFRRRMVLHHKGQFSRLSLCKLWHWHPMSTGMALCWTMCSIRHFQFDQCNVRNEWSVLTDFTDLLIIWKFSLNKRKLYFRRFLALTTKLSYKNCFQNVSERGKFLIKKKGKGEEIQFRFWVTTNNKFR